MRLMARFQEKLADRFSFVQYPDIRPMDGRTRGASRAGFGFKYAMPLGKRIDLFLISTVLLIVGLGGLGVGLFLLWVLIHAVFA